MPLPIPFFLRRLLNMQQGPRPGERAAGRRSSPTASLLLICREAIKPGSEAAYRAIEEEITRICHELKCPHPYIGAERLGTPTEVWFFNGFASQEQEQAVRNAYLGNPALMAAMAEASARKAAFTGQPVEVLARYRPERSSGTPWILGHGRFLVITIAKEGEMFEGSVFEAPDGTRFVIRSAAARDEADTAAARSGTDALVLAVRPEWSTPAGDWIEADPSFWKPYPPPPKEPAVVRPVDP